eukprot:g69014.t1
MDVVDCEPWCGWTDVKAYRGVGTLEETLTLHLQSLAIRPSTSKSTNMVYSESKFQNTATAQIHQEQLVRAELFNGRAAMLGFVIGVATEAIKGQGILHQIGLGALTSHGVM